MNDKININRKKYYHLIFFVSHEQLLIYQISKNHHDIFYVIQQVIKGSQ